MYMDIKPQSTTNLDLWNDWKNASTAKLVSAVGKKIAVSTGTKIPVRANIFCGYAWKIDVKTPTKELYRKVYGENADHHYFIYQAWNARKF